MQSMKSVLASLVAGAVVIAGIALSSAGATAGGDVVRKRSPAASGLSRPVNGPPWGPRIRARLQVARAWAEQATNERAKARHLARLTKHEANRRNGQRPPIETPLMLKWVAGAAVGLVAFHFLPVWPLVKLVAAVAVAVGGAVYLPPAVDAWRASPAPDGAPNDWWKDYKQALAAHKEKTLPHLRDWSRQGVALMKSGLDKLGDSLAGKPAAASSDAPRAEASGRGEAESQTSTTDSQADGAAPEKS